MNTNDSSTIEHTSSNQVVIEGEVNTFFDSTQVLSVEIELDSADWEFVRDQRRDVWENLMGEACLSEEWDDPYEFRNATLTLNGNVIPNVGIRKKGFLGSVNSIKPSLKIKLDEYVEGQEYFGLDRITLNNNISDPSHITQCLSYQLFLKAGLPAPQCNFAQVTVNGTYLGLYSNIESIKKRFLRRHFQNENGFLFEGTQSDFREGWTATFEQKTNKKEDGFEHINGIINALESNGDSLVQNVSRVIDLDEFYTFWGLELLIGHSDGMTSDANNFYFYFSPTNQKAYFIPWGVDKTFTNISKFSSLGLLTYSNSLLPFKLYSYSSTREQFKKNLEQLLDDVWDEGQLLKEVDRLELLLSPLLTDEPDVLWDEIGKKQSSSIADGNSTLNFQNAIESVRTFIQGRKEKVQSFLDSLPTPLEAPFAKLCEEKSEDKKIDDTGDGKEGDEKPCTNGESFDHLGVSYLCENERWTEKDTVDP
ncbi:MAG: CotH kinase family protein [Fibrobacterales bacterium]